MGRKRRLLFQYQPTAGVNADFEQLLQRFTSTETVRFEKFAEIWRAMKMSFIFAGRDSDRECREYTEEILKMALKYLLPPYNFQVRVGGLYLLYGLYNQQPLVRKARIRVTPDKWKEIVEFQREARRQQHLDVNYVFHKLRLDNAFLYVATDNEITFHLNTGSTDKKEEDTAPDEFKDEQSVLYDLFSDQFLEQLTQLHDHYHKVKVGLEGPEAEEPSRSLNVIQTNIVPSILGTVLAYQQRKQHHMKKGTSSDTEDDFIKKDYLVYEGERRSIKSTLKEKAYRNVARANRSRRHRQAVDSADDSPEKGKRRRRRKKNSLDTETSPKKRRIGKKKTVKVEEDSEEEPSHHTEEESENQNTSELVGGRVSGGSEGETTPGAVLHMPSFDVEPSTSGTQKSSPNPSPKRRGRPKKKSIIPDKSKKGKMPSVHLKSSEKKKKPRIKVETNTEKDDT